MVIRDEARQPINIVGQRGNLRSSPALFECWRDHRTQALARKAGERVFGVASMRDVALLRAAGLAAAPMHGLDRLTPTGLRMLARLAGDELLGRLPKRARLDVPGEWTFTSDALATPHERHTLVQSFNLVLCTHALDPAGQSTSPQFERVAQALASAERFAKIIWSKLFVWWPTPEEMEELDYIAHLRSTTLLRRFFLRERVLYDVADFADPGSPPRRPGPPANLLEARQGLLEAGANAEPSAGGVERFKEATGTYRSHFDREIISPLVEQALRQADPVRRARLMALAETVRLGDEQAIALRMAAGQSRDGQIDRPGGHGGVPGVREFLATVGRIASLAREERR